jgi:hypothetical protein
MIADIPAGGIAGSAVTPASLPSILAPGAFFQGIA